MFSFSKIFFLIKVEQLHAALQLGKGCCLCSSVSLHAEDIALGHQGALHGNTVAAAYHNMGFSLCVACQKAHCQGSHQANFP